MLYDQSYILFAVDQQCVWSVSIRAIDHRSPSEGESKTLSWLKLLVGEKEYTVCSLFLGTRLEARTEQKAGRGNDSGRL